MKTFITILLGSIICFSSCRKEKPNDEPNSTFSFYANGVHYAFDGVLKDKKGSCLFTYFFSYGITLNGEDTDENYMKVTIYQISTVTTGNYSADAKCRLKGIDHTRSENFILSITSFRDGLASGSFTGDVFLDQTSTIPVRISNGKFNDLKVIQTL